MKQASKVGLGAAATALALLLLLPLGGLILRALTDGDVFTQLTTGKTWDAIQLSMFTATIALLVTVLLGTPLAYLLAHSRSRVARLTNILIDLPLVLPPTVAGIALLTAFGGNGYLGNTLEELGIRLSFTVAAVILAQIFVAAPFYIRAAYAGFVSTDPRFEGVAYTLGLSRWRTFRSITLPLIRPTLVGGALLCWARALGELGATLLFAGSLPGKTQTMPLAILDTFESEAGLAGAVSLAAILLGFAFILLLALHRVTHSNGPYR
jgi:molybdate transport system permease protein